MTPNISKNKKWISARIPKDIYADLEKIVRETDFSTKTEVIEESLKMLLSWYNDGTLYPVKCPDCGILVFFNFPDEDPHDYHKCSEKTR